VLEGAGEHLLCMAHDRAGYLWCGHADGTLRVWALEGGVLAAGPLRAAAAAVTALAVDPDTGYAWAGTAEGEVVVVR
jgi:ligand-binding sensor domain-containing protein